MAWRAPHPRRCMGTRNYAGYYLGMEVWLAYFFSLSLFWHFIPFATISNFAVASSFLFCVILHASRTRLNAPTKFWLCFLNVFPLLFGSLDPLQRRLGTDLIVTRKVAIEVKNWIPTHSEKVALWQCRRLAQLVHAPRYARQLTSRFGW